MSNLKVLAACLLVVFIGLFVFDSTKKKEEMREVASIDDQPSKEEVIPVKKVEQPKVIPPPTTNMALLVKEKGSIPEAKDLQKDELPVHKGRFVARIQGGKLLPPMKGSTKELLFSKDPTHPDIEKRANNFFSSMGFNEDKKMQVERGKSYFLIQGGSALKVEAFKVSYNWNGNAKKATFLIKSTSGRYYRKLREVAQK